MQRECGQRAQIAGTTVMWACSAESVVYRSVPRRRLISTASTGRRRELSGAGAAAVTGSLGARFRWFVAEALGVAPRDVVGFVLGTHGDTMVPVLSLTSVNGVPVPNLLAEAELRAIVDRTRAGGAEIVNLLKSGSAYYAPSASQAELLRAVVHDEHRLLSVTTALDGPYGYRDLYLGVPARIGRGGVESVYEVDLTPGERAALDASAAAVKADLALLAALPAP